MKYIRKRRLLMKKVGFYWILVLGLLWTSSMTMPALAAYSSHQNDQDVNNFLTVYPFAKSTKLDDCSLCHPGRDPSLGKSGSCDYCHQTYETQTTPWRHPVPLNSYGKAYKDAGRTKACSLNSMETINSGLQGLRSDDDKYTNIEEIQALTFPGDRQRLSWLGFCTGHRTESGADS